MAINNQTKINFLVSFLRKNDNKKLESLKSKFGDFREYLEPGIMLGGDEEVVENQENNKINEYKFRLEVSYEALKSIFNKADNVIIELKAKLKTLNNLQLIGQIIVLISGATILSTIQSDFGGKFSWLKFIAPSLVLVSSILTIWAKNKSEAFLFGDKNLYESTSDLISLKNQAKFLISEAEIIQKYFSLENAKPLIESANKTAEDMINLIDKI